MSLQICKFLSSHLCGYEEGNNILAMLLLQLATNVLLSFFRYGLQFQISTNLQMVITLPIQLTIQQIVLPKEAQF